MINLICPKEVRKQTKSGFCLGDTIVYSGDVGREMYIMRRGLVEVLSKNKENVVATLGPGGYFGEVWNADLTHYRYSSIAFHIEATHLICTAKQMTGFCMECKTGLKWLK